MWMFIIFLIIAICMGTGEGAGIAWGIIFFMLLMGGMFMLALFLEGIGL